MQESGKPVENDPGSLGGLWPVSTRPLSMQMLGPGLLWRKKSPRLLNQGEQSSKTWARSKSTDSSLVGGLEICGVVALDLKAGGSA